MPAPPSSRHLRSVLTACTGLIGAMLLVPASHAADGPAANFTRLNVDTAIQGASFTSVGEVFPGESNIVTSGFGPLGMYGMPAGGGTVQVYRPRASLSDWRKTTVFDASAEIVFPNRPTIADVNGDGRPDVIVPSGYFFDTNPQLPATQSRGAITWWENTGTDGSGAALPFIRHDVITGQAGSYHGVELADLDADGIKDIVSTSEEGKVPSDTTDDTVQLQFFKGRSDHTFEAPVTLSTNGGSLPVVQDVDGDGRLDLVSAQYFGRGAAEANEPTFMWFRQVGDTSAGLTPANFERHTIATLLEAGLGFQIRPVIGFRKPGKVSWIGTNHMNRCAQPYIPIPEMVMEFVPGNDPEAPWQTTNLAVPSTPADDPLACDAAFKAGDLLFHPGDEITSRATQGQAAPGVFGYGDVDGDGDVDLLVSGDGDRRLFWIEQRSDGSTTLRTLTAPGEEFGQAGGAVVTDLDGDGRAELVFSSFDRNTLAVWKRTGGGPFVPPTGPGVKPGPAKSTTTVSTLRVTPGRTRVRAGHRAVWKIRLKAAPGGPQRKVTIRFLPTKGKSRKIRVLTLAPRAKRVHTGRLTWRPTRAGRLEVRYSGVKVSSVSRDTGATRRVKVRLR